MAVKVTEVCCFFLVLAVLGGECAQLLRLKDNKYEGVLVAISPRVPERYGERLISRIKDLFQDASRALFRATYEHASFGNVTIVVPKTWSKTLTTGGDAYYSYNEAHVRVDNPLPAYGDAPYTQQPGGCGQEGDFIHLTPEFILNKSTADNSPYGNPGKVLLHEWAHFRYGVFDEYGYPDDPIYPHVYVDGTKPKLTSCTDVEVDVQFNDDCKVDPVTGIYNRTCKYSVDLNNSKSKSSIMGMHFLPEVEHFCNRNSHKKYAPTKQNIMCNGKSTWEVINQHPDFVNFRTKHQTRQPDNVNFNIVRAKKSSVFVILDNSQEMKGSRNDRFPIIIRALKLLPRIVPPDTKLGFRMFADLVDKTSVIDLGILTSSQQTSFGSVSTSKNSASFNAMEDAIDIARKALAGENGGIILLVTSGAAPIKNIDSRVHQLCERVQQDNVRIMSVLYSPFSNYQGLSSYYLPLLADRTNGKNFIIHEITQGYDTKLDVLSQLTSSFLSVGKLIEPYPEDNFVVLNMGLYNGKVIQDSIYLDSTVGIETKLFININKENDINMNSLKIIDQTGQIMNNFNRLEFFNSLLYPIPSQTGWLNYSMNAETSISGQSTVLIFTCSFPKNNEGTITVRTWTNAPKLGIDAERDPLVIYAEVKSDSKPVINAKVIANIQCPSVTNNYTTIALELKDNGNGAPDTSRNDGIYSRYFTSFNEKGSYTFSVTVDSTEDTAMVSNPAPISSIMPVNPDDEYCCGSKIPVKDAKPTGRFQRISNNDGFNVSKLPLSGINFPPSRVNDLHIKSIDPVDGVKLTWTAPGEDYDIGRASKYECKGSKDRNKLQEEFDTQEDINQCPIPAVSGTTEELTVLRSMFTEVYEPTVMYYAIRAVDNDNRKADVSNIITVQYPAAVSKTSSTESSTSTTPPTLVTGGLSRINLIIIASCCSALILLILILLIGLIIRRNRNKKAQSSKAPMPAKSKTESTLYKNPPKTGSPVQEQQQQHTNGSIYTVSQQMSPQFMSASDLLARHEQLKVHRDREYLENDEKPPFTDEHNYYAPTYERINPSVVAMPEDYYNVNDYYISRHDNVNHNPFLPYGRTSLSDKPSSSFTSLSTNEPRKDNGYFTSYEETSEDSNTLRPQDAMNQPLSASKSSLAKRVVAESQV